MNSQFSDEKSHEIGADLSLETRKLGIPVMDPMVRKAWAKESHGRSP